ncbi:MAG: helix-turn-helix transcriptional regulator, partial [Oscillospiraceae bacterium]|nr:helix-turn-helix transcriptional regulator [Oscillospiraceae bacterium]
MDKQKFPQLLSEERTRRGYTQKQVALALGVSDKTYSKWETGVNEMTVETLCRLAEFYGCSPADLFKEETPKEGSPIRAELETLTPVQAKLRAREIMDE